MIRIGAMNASSEFEFIGYLSADIGVGIHRDGDARRDYWLEPE